MNTQQDQRGWFSVRVLSGGAICVTRFETREQAELHAAMIDGFVPFTDYLDGFIDNKVKHLYEKYLALSEQNTCMIVTSSFRSAPNEHTDT